MNPLLERMALAILRGDRVAAYAACDLMNEEREQGRFPWPALQKIATPGHRVMAFFEVAPEVLGEGNFEIDQESFRDEYADWVRFGGPMIGVGINLVAVFERPFPEKPVEAAREAMLKLTQDERREAMDDFCRECYRELNGRQCHYCNDE